MTLLQKKGGKLLSLDKKLLRLYKTSPTLTFHDHSSIVFMSDCHRGEGTSGDNFLTNQTICFAALNYYYQHDYTYIELGDGDELWENRNMQQIVSVHSDCFWMLSRFYEEDRLIMLYGNHDMVKKNREFRGNHLSTYIDSVTHRPVPLFPNIDIKESLLLVHDTKPIEILLMHGHQADFLNGTLWILSRFLVRYVWKPLELIAIKDPTSAAKNYHSKGDTITKLYQDFCKRNHKIMITGHTHQPVFPCTKDAFYFNDGCLIHPRCITAIELNNGQLSLVKWSVHANFNNQLYIGKDILAGPISIYELYARN